MTEMIVGSFANPEPWVKQVFTNTFGFSWEWEDGRMADRRLTPEKMLSYSTMWYGVSKIAGHVAQLPVYVYRKVGRGVEEQKNHSLPVLLRRPNALQTSIVFFEQLMTHALIEGNGRAAIVRKGNRIVELLPMLPEYTVTIVDTGDKIHACKPPKHDRLRKYFTNPNESGDTPWLFFDDVDVVHIPGLSTNGITGLSLRQIASRNIGASIDAEQRLAKQMQAGFSGNLMLEAPPNMFRDAKDAEEFLDAFEKRHNGPEKAGKTGMLLEGMKAQVMALTNKDAEMTENRRFQRQDAALYLGLESILGDDSSVSYNSATEKNRAYLVNTLNKWLTRIEQEMEYKLLPTRQFTAGDIIVRFDTAPLLKSDFGAQVDAVIKLVQAAVFSRNDGRELLGYNPVEGGDEYSNPAITPGVSPAPEPPVPEDDDIEDPVARRAINSRLAFFIGGEQKKVIDAAKQATEKGLNFVSWLETFYSARWPLKMAAVLDELDLPRDEAKTYCDESKRRLLEACDTATKDTLSAAVKNVVSTWKNRANSIGVPEHV
jgi:HK97 family phage portal protein